MLDRCYACVFVLFVLFSMPSERAEAQADDLAVTATRGLLAEATRPQSDGSHNTLLIALRELDDPTLAPLFVALQRSPFLSMRIHGQLGAAALSPKRRLDLTALAETDDARELVQVLSAAIDDELIDNAGMATLLNWDGLELPLRQAIALRLMGNGGEVDTRPFAESLELTLDDEVNASRLLQYGLAALLFAEAGEQAGLTALSNLAELDSDAAHAVSASVLEAAMRQGHDSAGGLALAIAGDDARPAALRLLAIQAALRFDTPGAREQWRRAFDSAEGSAPRIRLAMVLLDAAEQQPTEPDAFAALDGQGGWIAAIAEAGRAIARDDADLAEAMRPLIATGQPLSVQWVITYCRRDAPEQGPALLKLVIEHHAAGPPHQRGRMTQAAIQAATTLCEVYPEAAADTLTALLTEPGPAEQADALLRRQIVLMGIARAQSDALKPLAQAIEPDDANDFSTDALRLFIRARHDAPLTDAEWQRVSDIVQGVGQFDNAMRLQLGWAYTKHKGQADTVIADTLR
jgi:hypothetical protein